MMPAEVAAEMGRPLVAEMGCDFLGRPAGTEEDRGQFHAQAVQPRLGGGAQLFAETAAQAFGAQAGMFRQDLDPVARLLCQCAPVERAGKAGEKRGIHASVSAGAMSG